ncbi:hypothetical protein ACFPOE_15800 [Caenimonas terrae]|uniref:WxL domain-containing protein n=1 Tax=Caenimonas terrae TaxID=696074 RepID=A0ABW0NF92_9BURK
MNAYFGPTRTRLALAAALALAGSGAMAGTVGGSVAPINTLVENDTTGITIVGATGQTDTTIVTGTIDNNSESGWKLTVTSANTGKLVRTSGSGGPGAGREILYTNVKFVKTGGTLGAGLTDPNGSSKNIVTGTLGGGVAGTTIFNTGSAVGTPGTATTATVGYAYALKISWSADTSLLSGTYSDSLTLTLADDS